MAHGDPKRNVASEPLWLVSGGLIVAALGITIAVLIGAVLSNQASISSLRNTTHHNAQLISALQDQVRSLGGKPVTAPPTVVVRPPPAVVVQERGGTSTTTSASRAPSTTTTTTTRPPSTTTTTRCPLPTPLGCLP